LLCETLQAPGLFKVATGILLRGIVGKGRPPETIEMFDDLRAENADWIKSNPMAQSIQVPNLDLCVSLERLQPTEFERTFDDIKVLIKFNHPPVQLESEITEDFVAAFRGLWRAINLLQVLNSLHIEFPGLDTLDLPTLASESDDMSTDIVWTEVRAEVLEEYHGLIDALIAAQIDAPDAIGEEIMEGNRVLGGAEIGWTTRNLWVTDDDTIKKANVINWDLTAETLPAVVAEIILRLEKNKGNNV
jgi:hypothetical protein